ncbi:hypothetical protein MMC11_008836 [Xylographa trunciseda]|nr:hypothetical protein [Xylographa trunciseda]
MKKIDLSCWTGDSSENGTDECATEQNDHAPVQQKEEIEIGDVGEEETTKKEVGDSEPTPPSNPMPATPKGRIEGGTKTDM